MVSIFKEDFPIHPSKQLSNKVLVTYLQEPKTYAMIHQLYTNIFTEYLWLDMLETKIVETLKTFE